MKLTAADIEDEDFYTINAREKFNTCLLPEDVILSKDVPLVVRYDYVDMGKTPYNFAQEFTHEETIGYFKKLNMFSGNSLNSILSNSREHHFYRSPLVGNIRKAVAQILPDAIKSDQIIYHFSLTDSKEFANRKTGVRCPRVYFMLGTYGHIYILFFDPFHELNPIINTQQ